MRSMDSLLPAIQPILLCYNQGLVLRVCGPIEAHIIKRLKLKGRLESCSSRVVLFLRVLVLFLALSVIFVKINDTSWRMCTDYRAFNRVTVLDKYPIPVCDELLYELF